MLRCRLRGQVNPPKCRNAPCGGDPRRLRRGVLDLLHGHHQSRRIGQPPPVQDKGAVRALLRFGVGQKTEHHLPCRRKGNIIRQRNLPSPQCSRPAEGTNPRFGTVSIAQLHRAEILPGTKTGCAVFPPLLLIRTADGGQIVIVGTRVPDGIALRTEGFGGISPRARIQENRLTVRKDRYGTDIVVVVAGVVMPALDGEIQPALLIGELPRDEQLKILQQDALRRLICRRVLRDFQCKPAKPVVGRLPTAPEVPERTVLPVRQPVGGKG